MVNHISRLEDVRYSLNNRHTERRRPGRPLKTLLDGYNHEAETGHLLA